MSGYQNFFSTHTCGCAHTHRASNKIQRIVDKKMYDPFSPIAMFMTEASMKD